MIIKVAIQEGGKRMNNVKMNDKERLTKIAIDSFVYFYLGVKLERGEEVLDAVIKKAYSDATQQGAYNIPVSKVENVSQEYKEFVQNQSISYLKQEISNYKKHGSREKFKDWHKLRCQGILNQYKDINKRSKSGDVFSYGNAQKLVNMTLKYIYLLGVIMDFTNIDECFSRMAANVLEDEKFLDIPIDRYIMQVLWEDKEFEEVSSLMLKKEKKAYTKRGNKKYSFTSAYGEIIEPWSLWNKDRYYKISDKIHEIKESPIIWECETWIDIQQKNKRR